MNNGISETAMQPVLAVDKQVIFENWVAWDNLNKELGLDLIDICVAWNRSLWPVHTDAVTFEGTGV